MKRALLSRGPYCHQFGSGYSTEKWKVFPAFLSKQDHFRNLLVSTPCNLRRPYGHTSSCVHPVSEYFTGTKKSRYQQDRDQGNGRQLNDLITEHGKKGDWRKILEIHQLHNEAFNAINYSTALNQLAKILSTNRKNPAIKTLLEGVASHIEKKPSEWSIRTKVMTIHSIAKMRLDFPVARKLMNLILQDAISIVEDGNAISVSLTAWSVATMKLDCPPLFGAIELHASHLVKTGNPQTVANTVWSFATMRIDCLRFLDCIDQHAVSLVDNGNPQTMANTVWACAKLGVPCPTFFRNVDEQAERLVEDGSIQAIANSLWSFASLGLDCPRLARAACERANDIVSCGSPQNIANMAWSFATMGIECPSLFQVMNRNPSCVVASGDKQAVANVAWAFAALNRTGTTFFRAIDDRASHILHQNMPIHTAMTMWGFASQGIQAPLMCAEIENDATSIVSKGDSRSISTILWSFATLGVACPNLCRAVHLEAKRLIKNGTSQSVANTFWSMSILGYDASAVFEAFRDYEVDQFMKLCNNQEIVNLCFAFAVSGALERHSDTFTKLWKLVIEIDWSQLTNEGRIQLIQTYLISSHVYSLQLEPPAWTSEALSVDGHESITQHEVSEILKEIGFHHEREVSPFCSNFAHDLWMIDCACRDRKIAIEFDGPFHFLRSAGSRRLPSIENGPTKAKRRFLQSLGWSVINIPYLEWSAIKTREEKRSLLAAKLESINV